MTKSKLNDIDFWSKEYGRPVTQAEVDEIKHNLTGFVDWLEDAYYDFKRRGFVNEKGEVMWDKLEKSKTKNQEA